MMNFLKSLIFYFLFAIYSHAAPFQNGSFEDNSAAFVDGGTGTDELSTAEQDLTGWTIEHIAGADSMDWKTASHQGTALAGGGNYKIELPGNAASQMRIYQIFDTIAGEEYQVTYYLYGRSTATASGRQIAISIKNQNSLGTTLNSRIDAPSGDDTWHKYIINFTASSSTTYLSFNNTISESQGSFLDLININILPQLVSASKTYVYDPAHDELKAIPGNDMVFMYSLENNGGVPDGGTISMQFNIPTTLSFKIDSFIFNDGEVVGSTGYDPMFDGDATGGSGLSCCISEISYSTDGVSFTYTPSPTYYNDFGEGYDPNVRAIRIIPSGTMTDGTSSPTGFRVYYQAQIQ